MASIDRCSVSVVRCCCRTTERSTVALERSSTSTVSSADCVIDVVVDSSATAVRHSATAMADEQPRKMFFSLSSCVSSMKLSGASIDTGSTNEVSSYDEDEEMRTEEQMDRSKRDGGLEESGKADMLQTVDLMDRSDVHGRPSERQNDGFLRDDQTVNLVDRSDIHGRPSARQNDVSLGDDQTVDREVEDGRPSPRQKVSDPEQLQTVDPVDRSTDGGRPSSSQQAVENLGRGQCEKRPNVRLADYATHVAGSHIGENANILLPRISHTRSSLTDTSVFSAHLMLEWSPQVIQNLTSAPLSPPNLALVVTVQNTKSHEKELKDDSSAESHVGDAMDSRPKLMNEDDERSNAVEINEELALLEGANKVANADNKQADNPFSFDTIKLFDNVDAVKSKHQVSPREPTLGEIPDESGSNSSPSIDHFEDDEEMPVEEQLDRSTRNGRPEETSEAGELQAVDLVDRPDVHGRPSERQKDGPLGVQPTVDVVDRFDDHGRPSEGQKDRLQRDDETVDREEENGRPSLRQKEDAQESFQTVDPKDRSTDGGRPSSPQKAAETLGRGQRERRPNVRLADYVTHVAGPHIGEKCRYPLSSYVTYEKFSHKHKCFLTALDEEIEPRNFK
ncbi:unnamed protein product [Cuscuta campestris]|uniref:Uncharacterized protein n=2 Tax=Cuscuta campestris TaxID=132261 RepID=A0A484KQ06_9ASTE|nr:unnamed protein product [Cuscuta campestris]